MFARNSLLAWLACSASRLAWSSSLSFFRRKVTSRSMDEEPTILPRESRMGETVKRHINNGPIFAAAFGLEHFQPVARGNYVGHGGFFLFHAQGQHHADRLSQDFRGRISVNLLGPLVPGNDPPVEILADDGVVRGIHDGGQPGAFFDPAFALDHPAQLMAEIVDHDQHVRVGGHFLPGAKHENSDDFLFRNHGKSKDRVKAQFREFRRQKRIVLQFRSPRGFAGLPDVTDETFIPGDFDLRPVGFDDLEPFILGNVPEVVCFQPLLGRLGDEGQPQGPARQSAQSVQALLQGVMKRILQGGQGRDMA